MDFFEEIAKIRSTRRLFARMMKEEFGAKDRRSWSAVITSHTSGLSLTPQQPVNNIVRGTIQSLALVLAGVQALEISAFDEAYRTPSPESHMVALRTQQILHLESNVSKVVDPLGGSYFVESLTDEMEQRIRERIREIEAMGDPSVLADKGWFRKFFEDTMAESLLRMRTANDIFAVMIAFGVVYNAARISLAERSREMATLRVLGFTRGEISAILLGELAVLTAAAIPIGLVVGYGLSALAVAGLATETQRFPLVVDPSTHAMAAIVVLVSAALSALVVRRRLDRLDLVGVLKERD
jgi:cell division protein FtsX